MIKLECINVQYSIISGWKTFAPTNTLCSIEIHPNYIVIDNKKNWFYDFVKRLQPLWSLAYPFPILIIREGSVQTEHKNSAKTMLIFKSTDSTIICFDNHLTFKDLESVENIHLKIDVSFLNLKDSEVENIKKWIK